MGIALICQPLLPSWFSYQDPIDPNNISFNYDPSAATGIFNNQTIPLPAPNSHILGDTVAQSDNNTSNKRIEVNLTNQQLYAYEDNRLVFNYTISSGTWNRTPNGTFTVWAKVRSQTMKGGSKELGTYYNLPNVPYILFFYNDKVAKKTGYSIHGTYWHNNFGIPMSHGCINMRIAEAAPIYNWAGVGTRITIYGKYVPKLSQR